jgi:membrane-associated protein
VILFSAVLLPLTSISITDWILQYGAWVYLIIFFIIMLASTIAGGPIPDNTFLVLLGAGAMNNGLSMAGLFLMAAMGGFAGYEINYWSGRLFGLAVCRGVCPRLLHEGNLAKSLALVDRYGPAALILSRFMPVLNLPSFIAGMNGMEYRRYIGFNLMSSAVWCGGLLTFGFYLGSFSVVSTYIDLLTDIFIIILVAAIVITLMMTIRDYARQKQNIQIGR